MLGESHHQEEGLLRKMAPSRTSLFFSSLLLLLSRSHAFTPRPLAFHFYQQVRRNSDALAATATSGEEVETMSARELKAALVELGARTDGLFDKDSLRQALIEARAKPPPSSSKDSFSTTSSSSSTSASTSVGASGKAMEESSHAERVERALSDIRGNGSVGSNYPMSVKEMKQQLAALGVSVAGFFERSEFELALAEAVANGKSPIPEPTIDENAKDLGEPQKYTTSSSSSSTSSATTKEGGAFGANMDGMGGMLGDLFSGGMPGGGMPGGGMPGGGMPGGGMQEMIGKVMSNPDAMKMFQKVQSNPRLMNIMQEIMANPAAISKYQDDKDVKEMIDVLKGIL